MIPILDTTQRSLSRASEPLRPIRVMIVEDSLVLREFLAAIVGRDPRLEIVAMVASGEEAVKKIHQVNPDVISMDIRLPGMDGLETTRRIMSERPTPIVVVAANVESEDLRISINSLRAGALTVLEKPAGSSGSVLEAFAERLCTQLAIMSQVKVITQRNNLACSTHKSPPVSKSSIAGRVRTKAYEIIGITSSTGGPNALVQVLGGLEKDFPVPILLVQHITPCFSKAFIEWLNEVCQLEVVEARTGDIPKPGIVYVAPADRHLKLLGGKCVLSDEDLICMQRPSGTILLESMAHDIGSAAIGIVLTGMGEDGAAGLLALHEAGSYTIAEHESTAVVYGMPGAAVNLGAATETLPLQMIHRRIRQLVGLEERVRHGAI